MKTLERECLLCKKYPGRCPVCGGSGSLGSVSHRGSQRIEITPMGPTLSRDSWEESYSCSLCSGRGRCFRCNGNRIVTVPVVPHAIPGGLVTTIQLILQDQHWQDFLAENPESGGGFERLGSSEIRQAALKTLASISDRELDILHIFVYRQSKLGWEYDSFRKRLSHQYNRDEINESLGILAENAIINLTSRSDAQGLFVAIELSRSDEVRLLKQVLLKVADDF